MIAPADIAVLAELYDRYANAFERNSPDPFPKAEKLKS